MARPGSSSRSTAAGGPWTAPMSAWRGDPLGGGGGNVTHEHDTIADESLYATPRSDQKISFARGVILSRKKIGSESSKTTAPLIMWCHP